MHLSSEIYLLFDDFHSAREIPVELHYHIFQDNDRQGSHEKNEESIYFKGKRISTRKGKRPFIPGMAEKIDAIPTAIEEVVLLQIRSIHSS